MNDASFPTPWWQRMLSQPSPTAPRCLPTGHAHLDAALPGGGWRAGQVLEVCSPQAGEAEWRLLGEAVRRGVMQGQALALIQPPRSLPHDPWLSSLDEHLTCCWPGPDSQAIVEAGIQWLQAHPGGLLLLWAQEMTPPAWRALTRAARRHAGHVLLVRPAVTRWDDSPADVRLGLLPGRGRPLGRARSDAGQRGRRAGAGVAAGRGGCAGAGHACHALRPEDRGRSGRSAPHGPVRHPGAGVR